MKRFTTSTLRYTRTTHPKAFTLVELLVVMFIITPCASKNWKIYKVARKYRGARYNITIQRKTQSEHFDLKMTVDGCPTEGNVIPIAAPGSECEVTVSIIATTSTSRSPYSPICKNINFKLAQSSCFV